MLRQRWSHALRSQGHRMPRHGADGPRILALGPARLPLRFLSSDPASRLMDWVAADGDVNRKWLKITEAKGRGLGLQAQETIPEGSTLVTLASSRQLSYDPETTDPELLALIRKVPKELWSASLGLALLSERAKGSESSFSPYVDLLPTVHNGIPIFFSPQAIKEFHYPPVVEQIRKRCQFMITFATNELEGRTAAFHGHQVDPNTFGWALATCSSRAFSVKGPNAPRSLLPIIDLANHSFDNNAKVVPCENGAVRMVATRSIPGGQEILLNYGDLSNDMFLLDYGFMPDPNPHDTFSMRYDEGLIEMAKEIGGTAELPFDTSAPWKQSILEKLRLQGEKADLEILVGGTQLVDPRLIGALRISFAIEEAQLGTKDVKEICDIYCPSDETIDKATLKTSMAMCAIMLAQFPPAEEEAQSASQDSQLDVHHSRNFRAIKRKAMSKAISDQKQILVQRGWLAESKQ